MRTSAPARHDYGMALVCCRKAAAVLEHYDGLGGLMAHLNKGSLSPQQRQAQVADIRPEGGGCRVGPRSACRMMQLLTYTDPEELVDYGDAEYAAEEEA